VTILTPCCVTGERSWKRSCVIFDHQRKRFEAIRNWAEFRRYQYHQEIGSRRFDSLPTGKINNDSEYLFYFTFFCEFRDYLDKKQLVMKHRSDLLVGNSSASSIQQFSFQGHADPYSGPRKSLNLASLYFFYGIMALLTDCTCFLWFVNGRHGVG